MKAWIIVLCAAMVCAAPIVREASAKDPTIKCPTTWLEDGRTRIVDSVVWPAWGVSPHADIKVDTETVEEGEIATLDLEGYDEALSCHYANGRRLVMTTPHGTPSCETLMRTTPRHGELKREAFCGYSFRGYPVDPVRIYIALPISRDTIFWHGKLGSKAEYDLKSGKYRDVAGTLHDLADNWKSKLVLTSDHSTPTDGDPPDGTTIIYTYKAGTLVGVAMQPPRSEFAKETQYIELIRTYGYPDHGTWHDPIQSWDGADGIKMTVRNYSMRDGKWVDDPEVFLYDSRRTKDILRP